MIGMAVIAVIFIGGAALALLHDDLWGRNQDEWSDMDARIRADSER